MSKLKFFLVISFLSLGAALFYSIYYSDYVAPTALEYMETSVIGSGNDLLDKSLNDDHKVRTIDGVRSLIDLSKVDQVAPSSNDIVPVEWPEFVLVQTADRWYSDEMEVAVYKSDSGRTVAYPLPILRWHQVVLDDFDDQGIMITLDPISGVLSAFDRNVNGEKVDFAVSGKIYNSNMLLYDKKTESLWQQISGLSVSGEHTGQMLKRLPISKMQWGDFKHKYRDAEVMSLPFKRDYFSNPYNNYEETQDLLYRISYVNSLFHPKSKAMAVSRGDDAKIYLLEDLKDISYIQDRLFGERILILRDKETGELRVYDASFENVTFTIDDEIRSVHGVWKETSQGLELQQEEIDVEDLLAEDEEGPAEVVEEVERSVILKPVPFIYTYWFSWMSFYPDSRIFTPIID